MPVYSWAVRSIFISELAVIVVIAMLSAAYFEWQAYGEVNL